MFTLIAKFNYLSKIFGQFGNVVTFKIIIINSAVKIIKRIIFLVNFVFKSNIHFKSMQHFAFGKLNMLLKCSDKCNNAYN